MINKKRTRLLLEIIRLTAITLIVYLILGLLLDNVLLLLLDNWDRLLIRGIHVLWFVIATLVLILARLVVFFRAKEKKIMGLTKHRFGYVLMVIGHISLVFFILSLEYAFVGLITLPLILLIIGLSLFFTGRKYVKETQ